MSSPIGVQKSAQRGSQKGSQKDALAACNDFVVKFANINGSGSASANELFARAILRMGVPVSPRNIFPSNIQGLPTWYEVRVSEQGWLGRRGGVDLMVAMNPQTWDKDLAEIEPGGYVLYDSSKNVPAARLRSDINAIGVPLTEMCNARYRDARERQLLKNIIYVGVLAALLGIEPDVVAQLLGEQYKGKDKLVKPNLDAFMMGLHHGRQQLNDIVQLRIERRDAVGDRIFIDGNTAAAMGAVYGGATVCAWYPITPSSSLAEAFARLCGKYRVDAGGHARFAILQAEDELASIGIVIGAAWNGARAFTATSGPGISLMQEFLGLAYFAELPAVVIDVQRGGPSTGMPTRTQQSDLLLAAYASHGDTKHVLLFPEDPAECFEMTALAFDLADRLQTPVFVMSDLDIGMNTRLTAPLAWDDERRYDRGKVMTLSRCRRRRYCLSHPARHPCEQGRVLHSRPHPRPLRPLQRGRSGVRRQHGAAAAQIRHGCHVVAEASDAKGQARNAPWRTFFRLNQRGNERGADAVASARRAARCAAGTRVPVCRRGERLYCQSRKSIRRRTKSRRPVALPVAQ